MYKIFITSFCLLLLSACAVPLTSSEMMPQFDFYDDIEANKFQNSIYIRNVDVLKDVGGLTPVTSEAFKQALISSFRQADLYSPEERSKYVLDAVMSDMEQPMFGFNLTATATTQYTLSKKSNETVVLDESVTVPCTKGISDAFNAEVRLRIASGCSVGENITHVIKIISTH